MKQIEAYATFEDYVSSIRAHDHAIPNVSQINEIGYDEYYIYDRIVFTNESNPELFAIAENAGWNYTSTSGVTNGELASLDIVDVMNAVVGQTALTRFNEFKYFNGITIIPRVLFSGIALTEVTIPASVTTIEKGAFDSFPQNAKITYLNKNVEFVDNLPTISVCYSGITSESRLCSGYTAEESTVGTKCMLIYVSGANNNVFIRPENFGYLVKNNSAITVENVIYINYYLNSSEPWMYTFASSEQVKYVEIKGDVTRLPSNSFNGCRILENIILPDTITSFGYASFGSCYNLTSVTIPDSVTSIESFCFYYCTSLTNITIPDSIKTIPSYCFQYCKGLTSITIPDSVTSIGYNCFQYCSGLTNITIPDSVTSIGTACFSNCTSLKEITIPDSVKTIGEYCFQNCSGITDVVIGSGVTSAMSRYVFTGCTSLTSVTINSNNILNKASNYSMSGYFGSQVLEYIIGDSVTKLGTQCFYNCSNLTDIRIGSGITSAGTSAFTNCTALTGVSIASQALLNSGTSVSGYFGSQVLEYIVESGVTTLGNACFFNCYNATAITIPNSVTGLGGSCLGYCSALENLVIPDSVTSVGNYCCGRMESLTGLTIGTGLTGFGLDCFYSAVSLTSVTIPDNIKVLGQCLFEAAINLENVTIGSGVTSVVYNAFRYDEKITGLTCDSTGLATSTPSYYSYENYLQRNLQELVFGNNVSAVGLYFSGCSGLTSITFGNNVASINASAFRNLPNSASTVVTFTSTSVAPTGVTNKTFNYSPIHVPVGYEDMYVSAFKYYKKAGDGLLMAYDMSIEAIYYAPAAYYGEQGVVAGESSPSVYYLGASKPATVPVRIFGSGSAKNSLLKIEIDNSIVIPAADVPASKFDYTFSTPGNHTVRFYYDGIGSIPPAMFASAAGLVHITIPDEITGISDRAFFYCAGLTGISGCNNVTSIGENAFWRTHSLTNFDIPKKVTYIGPGAFSASTSLETIHIPSGVTTMSNNAFIGCVNLRNVTFDEGACVTGISQSSFEGCYSLETISLPSSLRTLGHCAFKNCTGLTSIALGNGITTIGTESFAYCYSLKSINIPDSVTSIGTHVFNGCTDLESAVVGSGLTKLSQNCFWSCKSLTSVTIPNSVTTIERNCFLDCISLKNINLPSSVQTLGDSTFQGCTEIETLNLTNGIQTIGANCFLNCTGITGVTIPASLTTVGTNAFNGCSNIKRVDYLGTLDDWCGITRQGNAEQWTSNPVYYSRNLYIGGNLVTTVNPTTAVTSIGNYAFANITGITSVIIPDSVTVLGNSCFYGCSNITEISFGTGLTSLSQHCFRSCSSLSAITIPGNIETINGYCFYQDTGIKEVILEDGVKVLNNNVFNDCSNLTGITVPTSVTSFGNDCFLYCDNMKRVDYLGTPEEWYTNVSTVNYRGNPVYFSKHIYFNGQGDVIDNLTITADTVMKSGCYYWTDLTAVTIGTGASISTFEGSGIREIKIPSGATIPTSWFLANCPSLRGYVNIPEGAIGNMAGSMFYQSHLLEGASIPSTVTSITGSNTFATCWFLNDVAVYPTAPPTLSNINHFSNTHSMGRIYVPGDSLTAYQTATNWKSYSGRMESIELTFVDQNFEAVLVANGFDINGDGKIDKYEAAQIRDIGTIFAGTNITSTRDLALLYRVTGLTANAFSGCTNLTEIRIPGTVDTIGNNCFAGCSAAVSATILGTRMTIGTNIFNGSNVSRIYCFPGVLDAYSAYSAMKSELSYIASNETNPVFMDVARENGWVSSTATAMTASEAGAVTTIDTAFQGKRGIYHLCELQYFTGLTSISNKGLILMPSVVKIVIPEGITTVGYSGFGYNLKLEVVKLPDTLTTIRIGSFKDDISLNRIEIPASVVTLEGIKDFVPLHEIYYKGTLAQWCAFSKPDDIFTPTSASCEDRKLFINGSLVTAITIDSGFSSVKANSFNGYKYAKRVDILANKWFDTNAFYGAKNIEEVHYFGTLDQWCLNDLFASWAANPCSVSHNLYVNENDLVTNLNPSTAATAITNFSFVGVDSITSVTLPNTLKTIGDDGFRNCRSISSVTIPDSVTQLGGYAFENCGRLTSVTLSSGLTGIGTYCFSKCSGLTSFNVPSNVKLIDNNAFSACTSLTSVTFNNNLVRLGNNAFDGCKSLTGVDLSNTIVSEIGSSCFATCVNVESVSLPETIKSIGSRAFAWNYALTTVSNPSSSYTSVEEKTYQYCRNLTGITLGPNVTQIRHEAFSGCTSLTEITIPSKVSVINRGAFDGCTALTAVNIDSSAITMNENDVFRNCRSLTGFAFDKISSASYGLGTFSNCWSLKNITLPSSLTAINYYDFDACSGVTSVTIPQTIKRIYRDAFRGMTSLENVYYEGTVDDWCTGITFDSGQDRPNPFAGGGTKEKPVKFYINGELLTSLRPTTAVTKINGAAFFSYKYLTEVELPDTVTEIGDFAFRWCTGFTSLRLPSGLTKVGSYSLSRTDIKELVTPYNEFTRSSNWIEGTSLNKVTVMADAISNAGTATGHTFNSIFGGGVKEYVLSGNVTTVGPYRFYNLSGVREITLGPNVVSAGTYSFYGCTGLIADTYNDNMFVYHPQRYNSATTYCIPDTIKYIAAGAFRSSFTLRHIYIPSGITKIYERTFESCEMLCSMVIASTSVVSLQNINAFNNCQINNTGSFGSPDSRVRVPSGLVSGYQTGTNWATLYNNNNNVFEEL